MNCYDVMARLDDYTDRLLPEEEREAVELHLGSCTACQEELARHRALAERTAALPRSVQPTADLWPGIEARLAARPAGRRAPPAPWRRRLRLALPLAAAIALMALASAVTALWLRRGDAGGGFAAAQAQYAQATAELARSIEADGTGLPSATRAALKRNLDIIDGAIREAEAALKAAPENRELEQMLLARYRQRLDLLDRAGRAGRESAL